MNEMSREEKETYVIEQMQDHDKNDIRRLSDAGIDGVIRILNRK